jgi:hypothetical protein
VENRAPRAFDFYPTDFQRVQAKNLQCVAGHVKPFPAPVAAGTASAADS